MKNIAIACGGYSEEHEISFQSAELIYEEIDRRYFRPFLVYILKGNWFLKDEKNRRHPIDRTDFSAEVQGKKICFDAVYNSIHGSPGEDGLLQAYFELIGLPQTASEHYPAALTFNKRDCINVLKTHGIKSAPNFVLNRGEDYDKNQIIEKVGLPCFVKANRAGSSLGITKVNEKNQLDAAIEHSYQYDPEIIIESALEGTEVSVSVINFKGKLTVLPITELVSDNEFFDYKAKYFGQSKEITPARISSKQQEIIEERAKRIARVLGLKGLSRAEFIFQDNEPYFLETNTVPGTTRGSIVPQQIAKSPFSFQTIITQMIELALNADQSK